MLKHVEMNMLENDLMCRFVEVGPLLLTHTVRFGCLDVHVARLFDRLDHQFLHGRKETLNIKVSEVKQLWEAMAEHDG